ncbi:hypothetical protein JCM5296_002598 [Sporobolomyces johnsonii]
MQPRPTLSHYSRSPPSFQPPAPGTYFSTGPRRSSLSASRPYDRPPPPAPSQQFAHSPPPVIGTRRQSAASDVEMSDARDDRRRPKTPPDCCAVCKITETPEWRKGPAGIRSLCNGCGLLAAKRAKEREAKGYAHPSSIEEIERELEGIGAERFKIPSGRFTLPPDTRNRILVTQERTRNQQVQQQISNATRARSRSKLAGQEKAAAGALMGMARRASVDTSRTFAPRSPPASSTRDHRSGSLTSSQRGSPFSIGSGSSDLPPSSSYMTFPPGGVGPSSSFSFGTHKPSLSRTARSPSPARPSSFTRAPAPVAGHSRGRAPSPGPATGSSHRMSIAHLISPRAPSPEPAGGTGTELTTVRRRSASIGPGTSPRNSASSLRRRPTS